MSLSFLSSYSTSNRWELDRPDCVCIHIIAKSPRCQLEVNAQHTDVQQCKDGSHHQDQQRDRASIANLIELERLAVLVDGQELCIGVGASCQDKDQGEIGERRQCDEQQVGGNSTLDEGERNKPNACPQPGPINRGCLEQFRWNAF